MLRSNWDGFLADEIEGTLDLTTTSRITVESKYTYRSRRLIKPASTSSAAGAIKIFVDGKGIGIVPSLKAKTFSIVPGSHQIQVKFRWYASKKVTVVITDKSSLKFDVTIEREGSTLLRLLFRPRKALSLRESIVD